MKISLVGAFHLADGFLGASKALEKLGVQVDFIPAYQYRTEIGKTHHVQILKDLKSQNPDVVLWWRAETLSAKQLSYIKKNIKCKHILYSWDDPFQWQVHKEMPEKCALLDMAFSCCADSVSRYNYFGCNALYCPPGFDPEIHFPAKDDDYTCDISIVCTNLYTDPLFKYHHYDRKKLLTSIIEALPHRKVNIYGSESFKNIFPDNYKGWVSFENSNKVFHNSKINICTHVRPDGSQYINERVCQILGSGGLLAIDHVKDLDKVLDLQKDCVVLDWDSEIAAKQLDNILINYNSYNDIKEHGRKTALSKLTWDHWATTILNGIKDI